MCIENEIFIFCENIKRLRLGHKLSKKEMAKKLGIDIESLTMIENGILPQELDCEVLFQIHRNFGVLPKHLFLSME